MECNCLFSRLPDELYLKIFRYLTHAEVCTCMQVCQKWNSLCNDDSLWREVKVGYGKLAGESVLSKLASNFPRIKGLTILSTELEARMSSKNFTCGENEWRRFENLESVTFISCPRGLLDSIQGLVVSCPKLQCFKCECSSGFSQKHLLSLFQPSRSYVELSFAHCTQIDDVSIYRALLNPNTSCLKRLEILNLDGVEFLSDIGIRGILEKCPVLRSLSLDGEQLTDEIGNSIGSNYYQTLEHLSISYCDNLTDSTLRSLGKLKNLQSLYMKRGPLFTNSGFVSLFGQLCLNPENYRNPRGLLRLTLIECTGLLDSGLTKVAQSAPNLSHLDLSWCWNLTDKGLQAIALNCHLMQTLILVGLKNCTAIIGASMPRLRYLELVQTDFVDDEQLRLLKLKKPWLTILDYYGEEVTGLNP